MLVKRIKCDMCTQHSIRIYFYLKFDLIFKYDGILCLRMWDFLWNFIQGFFFGCYFSWCFFSGGTFPRIQVMVHLLEYRPCPPSLNIGLGLQVVGPSKLNPLNIEVRGKRGGQKGCPIIFFPECIFLGGLFPDTIF